MLPRKAEKERFVERKVENFSATSYYNFSMLNRHQLLPTGSLVRPGGSLMRKTSKCFTHNHVSEKLKGLEPGNPPLEYIRKKPTVFAIKKPKRKKKEHGTISGVDERSLGLVEKNARDEDYKL